MRNRDDDQLKNSASTPLSKLDSAFVKSFIDKIDVHRELINKKNAEANQDKNRQNHKGASRLYLERLMHDQMTSHLSDEQLVDLFLSNKKYNKLQLNPDEFQKNIFLKILETESKYKDKISLVHAANPEVAFLYDLITELLIYLQLIYQENYKNFRVFPDFFEMYSTLLAFKSILDYGDQSEKFRETGMCANVFLFGSNYASSESTIAFFLSGKSLVPPSIKEYLHYVFQRLDIHVEEQIFLNIFNHYFKNSGVLYHILIDKEDIDRVALPTKSWGYFFPLITKEGKSLEKLSDILKELQQNPGDYKEYQNYLQARLFLDDNLFHDPNKVEFHTYYASSNFKASDYKKALSNAVKNALKKRLIENTNFSKHDLKYGSKLQYLFRTVDAHITDDVRPILPSPFILSIPRLIKNFVKENDMTTKRIIVSELAEIVLNDKGFNLQVKAVHPSAYLQHADHFPLFGNIFFENPIITAAVITEISNHVGLSQHQQNILQQLKTILYHRYIRSGEIENAVTIANQLDFPIQAPLITDEYQFLQERLHEIVCQYRKHPDALVLDAISQLSENEKIMLFKMVIKEQNWTLLLWLLDHGLQHLPLDPVDICSRSSILHSAARTVDVSTFNLLLEKTKLDINERNAEKLTPIHFAVMSGNWPLVDWLVQHHAISINSIEQSGKSMLHHAVCLNSAADVKQFRERCRLVAWLIEKGIDINARDLSGKTPLHDAAKCNGKMVEFLLQLGANKNAEDSLGQTALTFAAIAREKDSEHVLIQHGVGMGKIPNEDYSVLHLLAAEGDRDVLENLLSRPNIDLDQKSNQYGTPLQFTILSLETPRWDIAKLLLQNGAQATLYDSETEDKMIAFATRDKQWKVLHLFKQNGMSPEKINPALLKKTLQDYCKILRRQISQPYRLFNVNNSMKEEIAAIERYIDGDRTEHNVSILRNSREIMEIFKEFHIDPLELKTRFRAV